MRHQHFSLPELQKTVATFLIKLKNAQYHKHTHHCFAKYFLTKSSTHTDKEKEKGRAGDTMMSLWFLIVTLITNEVSSGFSLRTALWGQD